jgi:hypothetical protein
MQALEIGWEANLQNNEEQGVYGPLPAGGTLIGYQLDLSLCSLTGLSGGLFSGGQFGMVLWFAAVCLAAPAGWYGGAQQILPPSMRQVGGTNPVKTNQSAGVSGFFAAAILKTSNGAAVNKSLIMPPGSLSIPVPAGGYFVFQAGHSGLQLDFEQQGMVFLQ